MGFQMITYLRLEIWGFCLSFGFGFKSDSAGENSAESVSYLVCFLTFHFTFKNHILTFPSPEPLPSPEPSFERSPDHITVVASQPSPTQPLPTQPSPTQPSTGVEYHFPIPHDSPLHVVHSYRSDEGSLKLNELTNLVTKLSERIRVLEDDLRKIKKTYSSAFTKLILRVKKLEARVKIGKARRSAKVQEKASTKTKPFIQEVTPTELIQDQGSSEKGSAEVSTVGATKGTACEVPVVSTADGQSC
ncbi:hypothetical protein Tco_0088221 [Tanacetum coccineum]